MLIRHLQFANIAIMKVFGLSDLHLSFNTPDKTMDCFGNEWLVHHQKIYQNWHQTISQEDIVIIAGDISWAKKPSQAQADLSWIHNLPGQKIIIRGNHDYWWPRGSKINHMLPSSIHAIANNCVQLGSLVFFGSRLWDTPEYSISDIIDWDLAKGKIPGSQNMEHEDETERIYQRELERLKLSINSLPGDRCLTRIGVCHFPPLNHLLQPSRAASLFTQAGAHHVVFGHLHSVKKVGPIFGEMGPTHFHLTSSDYINFIPKLIYST
jgi:predicted phosphohydrolase